MKNHVMPGFRTSESGAVTTEFVLIFPLLVAFLMLIASTSALYATATELQQISFELARTSVRYAVEGREMATICADLMANHMATAYNLGNFISADYVRDITCNVNDVSRLLSVSVTYDMSNQFGAGSGWLLGIDVDSLTRTARLHL